MEQRLSAEIFFTTDPLLARTGRKTLAARFYRGLLGWRMPHPLCGSSCILPAGESLGLKKMGLRFRPTFGLWTGGIHRLLAQHNGEC